MCGLLRDLWKMFTQINCVPCNKLPYQTESRKDFRKRYFGILLMTISIGVTYGKFLYELVQSNAINNATNNPNIFRKCRITKLAYKVINLGGQWKTYF